MADVNISKFRASVVRDGSKPASPGFVVSEGQSPTDPAGSGQNHLPVTIAAAATGLAITESQILSGAGTVGQYIRGDGSLADFPSASGGGSSVSYYLNGSVAQGTIGGVAYKELSKVPVLGTGTDFTINADGYIASFLTDAGDPNLLEIPGGNWNFETYFSASSSGGTPTFYVELYKYDGSTFTLIASNSGAPEFIAFGTTLTSYFSTLAVPTTALALTDRLAIRYYVTHSGRTITLHTENNHLCQVITTFTTGLTALNGLTAQVQNFAVGTSGNDFNIVSASATHTFNLPTATATMRGALSSADWSTFNAKQNALTLTTTGTSGAATLVGSTLNIPNYSPDLSGYVPTSRTITINGTTQDLSANRTFNVGTVTSVGLSSATSGVTIGSTPVTTSGTITLAIATASGSQQGLLSAADWTTFNNKQNALTNPVTGTGTTNYLAKFTGASTIGNSQVFDNGSNVGIGTASPGAKLEVKQTGSEVPFIIDSSSDSNAAYTLYQVNGSGGWETGMARAADGYSYLFSYGSFGTANSKLAITNSGNVGIGTTSPQVAGGGYTSLHVNGNGASILLSTAGANITYLYTLGTSGVDFAIENPGAQIFRAGSSERARITSGGNVLIGTTTDNGAKLQVSGSASVAGLLYTTVGNGLIVGGTGFAFAPSSTRGSVQIVGSSDRILTFGSNGSQDAYIYSSASVTQIVTTPNFSLVVGGSERFNLSASTGLATFSNNILLPADGRVYGNSATVTGSRSYLELYNGSTGDINLVTGFSSASIVFATQQGTERMRITSTGNVGIGTSNPTNKLTVRDDLPIRLESSSAPSSYYTIIGTLYDYTKSFVINNRGNEILTYSVDPGFGLGLSNPLGDGIIRMSTAGAERMRITAGGNVLIGTTSDAGQRLQVSGSIYLLNGGNRNIRIGSATNYYYDLQSTNDDFQIIEAGSTPRLTIKYPNGNVGIGTTSPLTKLMVQDSANTYVAHFSGLNQANGIAIGTNSSNVAVIQGYNRTFTSTNNIAMQIDNGQVLIGVAGQDGKVAIRTNSTATYNPNSYNGANSNLRLDNGSAGAGRFSGIAFTGGGSTEGFFGVVQNASTLAEFVWQTYNGAAYGERMRMTSSGNVLINTATDNGATLNVNGTIRTANPTGSTSDSWLLGRALVSGSSTPDRWIRVQIGNLYYDILAVYMGSV